MRPVHEIGKWLIVQWINEMNLGHAPQLLIYNFTYLWILVDWEDNLHILKLLHQPAKSLIYMTHWLTQVFPTMGGNQDNPLVLEVNFLEHLVLKLEIIPYSLVQGINNSITGNKDLLPINGL